MMLRELIQHHPPIRCYPSAALIPNISILEIGPGRGDFLFTLAHAHEDRTVGAIEFKRKRFEKLIRRLPRYNVSNVVFLQGDGRVVLPRLFKEEQIETIYILFSDPWPKKKHRKHRLFQSYFVSELYRILQQDGRVIVAHDDPRYLAEIERLFAGHPGFQSMPITEENQEPLFQTFYAEKWCEEGRTLEAHCFQKVSKNPSDQREREGEAPLRFCGVEGAT